MPRSAALMCFQNGLAHLHQSFNFSQIWRLAHHRFSFQKLSLRYWFLIFSFPLLTMRTAKESFYLGRRRLLLSGLFLCWPVLTLHAWWQSFRNLSLSQCYLKRSAIALWWSYHWPGFLFDHTIGQLPSFWHQYSPKTTVYLIYFDQVVSVNSYRHLTPHPPFWILWLFGQWGLTAHSCRMGWEHTACNSDSSWTQPSSQWSNPFTGFGQIFHFPLLHLRLSFCCFMVDSRRLHCCHLYQLDLSRTEDSEVQST